MSDDPVLERSESLNVGGPWRARGDALRGDVVGPSADERPAGLQGAGPSDLRLAVEAVQRALPGPRKRTGAGRGPLLAVERIPRCRERAP